MQTVWYASPRAEAGDAARAPSLAHVVALSDDVGIAQHATRDVPNRHEGYCTDDVARAFMVALTALGHEPTREAAQALVPVYLAFLAHAQREDGRFHNFMSYERAWLDEVGSPDSNGRAIWALGVGTSTARESWRAVCLQLLERALPHITGFEFVRSRAYAALGLAHAHQALGGESESIRSTLRALGEDLAARHAAASGPGWDWFEDELTYDNARLPEALLRIGVALGDRPYVELGLRTLAFYASIVVEDGTFVPIGNAGWYRRGQVRARYAQQPLEAASFVDAALAAEAATGDPRYRGLAECGFAWFLGRNSRHAPMTAGGGCYDGLEEGGVNQNMGAESTLAYVASALAVAAKAGATGVAR